MMQESGLRGQAVPARVLEALGPAAVHLGRQELAESVAPFIAALREPLPAMDRAVVGEQVIAFCKRFYGAGRCGDALPVAQALLDHACQAGDVVLERRVATVCGVLAADMIDVVRAVSYQVRALRLAEVEGDPAKLAVVWNNMGLAFSSAGNRALATRCYRRALATVEAEPDPLIVRSRAGSNLANMLYDRGDYEEGLRCGEIALRAAPPSHAVTEPLSAIVLRRNLIRLCVATGRFEEAKRFVDEVAAMTATITEPRPLIAAAIARGTYELAMGRTDIALTRLEGALADARSVTGALHDALASVARAEEAAGHAERALMRLQELSDWVYRQAIDRARDHVELAGVFDGAAAGMDPVREQARARLQGRLRPPGEPDEWKAYRRLGVTAVLRMDATGWHGMRVGALTKALALAAGLPPLQALEIGLAAELHDIGLMSVPEAIFTKKGELNDVERALVERHTEAGAEILQNDDHPRILLAHEIAKYHHARWDGAGYPARVGGRFIPLPARLCAVADAYDSMVCGLDHRAPMSMSEALAELRREAGRQFDPELVERFEAVIRDETADLGVDPGAVSGLESFQEIVVSLNDDRGFI